jgi:predicted TPR repeat methyltransferase
MDLGRAMAQAFAHLEAGRLADAARLARLLAARRPPPPGLDYLLGLIALSSGDGRKAARHLVKAVAATPLAVPPRLALARAQIAQDRLTAAIGGFRVVGLLEPGAADAELGEAFLRQGRFAEALSPLRRACLLGAASAGLLNNRGAAEMAAGQTEAAARCFRAAIALRPDGAKAYGNLVGAQRKLGPPGHAIDSASRATRLEPAAAVHWLELGQARRDAKQGERAAEAFRAALVQTPDSWEHYWQLAAVGQGGEAASAYRHVVALAPTDHLRALYDAYADTFEADLVGKLNYRGPEIVLAAVRGVMGDGPFTTLDLGCGTGLSGAALRPLASRLDGIDLSPGMAARAGERGVYDELVVDDLNAVLASRPGRYDLIAAVDVLIYQGDLSLVIGQAARALRPGGGFALTVEEADQAPFVLKATGRYAHSADHLRQAAAAAGLTVARLDEVSTRTEGGVPVPGLVVVMRKK